MANSFHFDVGDILAELKEARVKRLHREKYEGLEFEELDRIIDNTKKMDKQEVYIMQDVYEKKKLQY
jgi:hypothetical protein